MHIENKCVCVNLCVCELVCVCVFGWENEESKRCECVVRAIDIVAKRQSGVGEEEKCTSESREEDEKSRSAERVCVWIADVCAQFCKE